MQVFNTFSVCMPLSSPCPTFRLNLTNTEYTYFFYSLVRTSYIKQLVTWNRQARPHASPPSPSLPLVPLMQIFTIPLRRSSLHASNLVCRRVREMLVRSTTTHSLALQRRSCARRGLWLGINPRLALTHPDCKPLDNAWGVRAHKGRHAACARLSTRWSVMRAPALALASRLPSTQLASLWRWWYVPCVASIVRPAQ